MKIDIDGIVWENVKAFSTDRDGRVTIWGWLHPKDRPWERYANQQYSLHVYCQEGLEFRFETRALGNVQIVPEKCPAPYITYVNNLFVERKEGDLETTHEGFRDFSLSFQHDNMYSPSLNGWLELKGDMSHGNYQLGFKLRRCFFLSKNPTHIIRLMYMDGDTPIELMSFEGE